MNEINVFLWPCLAVLLERRLYDTQGPAAAPKQGLPLQVQQEHEMLPVDSAVAVSVQGLGKTFKPMFGRASKGVTAISDLTLDVPRSGIFVLLGSNGYALAAIYYSCSSH